MKNDQCVPEGPPTHSITGSPAYGFCTYCHEGTIWYCEGCCSFMCGRCVPGSECPECEARAMITF